MLYNVSNNDRSIREEINELVGASFSLYNRIKLKGIGSPKLDILSSSENIAKKLNVDSYTNRAYAELRPKGVCIYFRSMLETFVLVIPHYRLTIYNNSGKMKVYSDSGWMEFSYSKSVKSFFDKVMKKRVDYLAFASKPV